MGSILSVIGLIVRYFWGKLLQAVNINKYNQSNFFTNFKTAKFVYLTLKLTLINNQLRILMNVFSYLCVFKKTQHIDLSTNQERYPLVGIEWKFCIYLVWVFNCSGLSLSIPISQIYGVRVIPKKYFIRDYSAERYLGFGEAGWREGIATLCFPPKAHPVEIHLY